MIKTLKEITNQLGCHYHTVRKLIQLGEFKKVGYGEQSRGFRSLEIADFKEYAERRGFDVDEKLISISTLKKTRKIHNEDVQNLIILGFLNPLKLHDGAGAMKFFRKEEVDALPN